MSIIRLEWWIALSLSLGLSHSLFALPIVNSGDPAYAANGREFHFGDVTFLSKWFGKVAIVATDILGDSSLWYPKSDKVLPRIGCPVEIGWVHLSPAGSAARTPTNSYEVRVKLSLPDPVDSLLMIVLANVGYVSKVAEVDAVMGRAFRFLAPVEAESLQALCYHHKANITKLINLPVNSEPDAAIRRILRRSDLDPDDFRRVDGVDSDILSEALLGDSRVRPLVIYRRSRIFLREYTLLPEIPGIDLVCLWVEYLDESYPDTLKRFENLSLSLAIDRTENRVYVLNATYQSEPKKDLFPANDVEQFLLLMKQSGFSSSKQMSELVETRLLRQLVYPHRGLVLSTVFDTCMYRRSLEDESFLDLVESDSVIGVEAGAGLFSPSITPNLYEVWRQLYGYDCSRLMVRTPKERGTEDSIWNVWYRDNGKIERFELSRLEDGSPSLERVILTSD